MRPHTFRFACSLILSFRFHLRNTKAHAVCFCEAFLCALVLIIPVCAHAQGCTSDAPAMPSEHNCRMVLGERLCTYDSAELRAWEQARKSWCEGHGGTYRDGGNCDPGPNWCKDGGAGSSTSSELSDVLAKAIVYGDAKTRSLGIAGVGGLFALNLWRSRKNAAASRNPFNPASGVISDPTAELRRREKERMFAELKASLKMSGSQEELHLKGIGSQPGLSFKFGNGELLAGGYGICGLPGIYVSGPRADCPQSRGLQLKLGAADPASRTPENAATGDQTELGGLQLKLGNNSAPVAADNIPPSSLTARSDANSSNAELQRSDAQQLANQANIQTGVEKAQSGISPNARVSAQPSYQQPPQPISASPTPGTENAKLGDPNSTALGQLQHAANLAPTIKAAQTDEEASELARQQFESVGSAGSSSFRADPKPTAAAACPTSASGTTPAVLSSAPAIGSHNGPVRQSVITGQASTAQDRSAAEHPSFAANTEYNATPVVDPSVIQRSNGVNHGYPIFDCDGDQAKLNRLLAGRSSQQAVIDRTEVLFNQSSQDYEEASRDLVLSAAQSLTDATLTAVLRSRTLLARADMMKNIPGTPAQIAARWKILQRAKDILDTAHELEDLTNKLMHGPKQISDSYSAGEHYGNAVLVQHAAHNFKENVAEMNKLLQESGLWEEGWKQIGEKTATFFFGPIGTAGFNTATDLIDSAANIYQMTTSAEQAAALQKAVDTMRAVQKQISYKISDLQQEIRQNCDRKPELITTRP